jgi:hypothetical protein
MRSIAASLAAAVVWLSLLVGTCSTLTAVAQPADPRADGGEVEEIYVARSLRASRVDPTPYCSQQRVGFVGTTLEDRYTFHSVTLRGSDGLITNAAADNPIGDLHACLAPTADWLMVHLYGEGEIGDVSFTVAGECRAADPDHPEAGIRFYTCSFRVRDLPEPYVGGHLTASTILSRAQLGAVSDPPGYIQPSIATIRLWKRR